MNKGEKVALITFALFMTEAIVHYNLGKRHKKKEISVEQKAWIPPTPILIHLALIVGTFSIINGVIIKNWVD